MKTRQCELIPVVTSLFDNPWLMPFLQKKDKEPFFNLTFFFRRTAAQLFDPPDNIWFYKSNSIPWNFTLHRVGDCTKSHRVSDCTRTTPGWWLLKITPGHQGKGLTSQCTSLYSDSTSTFTLKYAEATPPRVHHLKTLHQNIIWKQIAYEEKDEVCRYITYSIPITKDWAELINKLPFM